MVPAAGCRVQGAGLQGAGLQGAGLQGAGLQGCVTEDLQNRADASKQTPL